MTLHSHHIIPSPTSFIAFIVSQHELCCEPLRYRLYYQGTFSSNGKTSSSVIKKRALYIKSEFFSEWENSFSFPKKKLSFPALTLWHYWKFHFKTFMHPEVHQPLPLSFNRAAAAPTPTFCQSQKSRRHLRARFSSTSRLEASRWKNDDDQMASDVGVETEPRDVL